MIDTLLKAVYGRPECDRDAPPPLGRVCWSDHQNKEFGSAVSQDYDIPSEITVKTY
jgi:hypothetical protein